MYDKNLLVITNSYPDKSNEYIGNIFVKEQVEYLKQYFNRIYVISPVAYGVEYIRGTHHEDYSYENADVFFPKYINIPTGYFHGREIWVHLEKQAILKLINRKKLNIDIIHAHFAWPSGAVGAALKRELQLPLVITHHARPLTLQAEITQADSMLRRMWQECDGIIRIKQGDLDLFRQIGVSLDKIYYVPDGFDPKKLPHIDKTHCRNILGLPSHKIILFSLSTLTEVKGHRYSVEAVAKICQKRKEDILYIIGGSGPLKDQIADQIRELKLQEHVRLIGHVPHDQLAVWMNACDIFVLPSLGEGFGIVQIEALSCGKPVVATYNGGSEEIIISEEYGLLCKPADANDLSDKISLALDINWNSRAIMEYAGKFTWEQIAKDLCNVYSQIISDSDE